MSLAGLALIVAGTLVANVPLVLAGLALLVAMVLLNHAIGLWYLIRYFGRSV